MSDERIYKMPISKVYPLYVQKAEKKGRKKDSAIPDAVEKISYRMPTFWKGRSLIHFAAFAKWIGLFPGGEATTVFADKLINFHTTKGGIRLPHNEPLPLELITEIAQWCLNNNAK